MFDGGQKMCKIAPCSKSPSAVLSAVHKLKKYRFWLKFSGWCCMPVCCIGATCLFASTVPGEYIPKYEAIIELYGGKEKMKLVAEKVHREMVLFRKAVTAVNNTIEPSRIKSDITLLKLISTMNPKFRQISSEPAYNSSDIYIEAVWAEYVAKGGNYHVVLYGIMEYMCCVYDPTCTFAEIYLNRLTTDTSLRVECLSHRADADL